MRHTSSIACILLVLASTLAIAQDNAQEDRTCDAIEFLVIIGETTIEMMPNGVTAGDRIVVMPNGRFHLERRFQRLPTPSATLTIFESFLNQEQLRKLQTILDSAEVKTLPSYTLPAFPLNGPWFGAFDVRVTRDTEIQHVGFLVWQGGSKETSPNSMPEEVKKAWRDSQITLRPLVHWFHEIEALKLEPSRDAKSLSLCIDNDKKDK